MRFGDCVARDSPSCRKGPKERDSYMSAARPKRRIDPPERPMATRRDDSIPFATVTGKDPNRVYKLVNPQGVNGVGMFDMMGYQVEKYREGGPRVRGIAGEDGQTIESMGMILMSCSKERAEEIENEGAFGGAGQNGATDTEAVIRSERVRARANPNHIYFVSERDAMYSEAG